MTDWDTVPRERDPRGHAADAARAPASSRARRADPAARLRRGAIPSPITYLFPSVLVTMIKGLLVVSAGIMFIYGPSYYECGRRRTNGLFFYGTTMKSCVDELMAEQDSSSSAFARALRGSSDTR